MGSRMQEMRPLMLGEERAPYIQNELRTTRTFFLDTVQHGNREHDLCSDYQHIIRMF
jgi:hypothetical protein